MAKDHVYHWKHGWIPLTHTAAMSKAKGNREKAAELLAEAKSEHAGIHKREHVGKAALDLTSISDPKHRADALVDVQDAAERLGAVDSLPSALRRPSSTPRDLSRTQLADGSHVQIRREQGKGGDVIAVRKLTQNPLTGEISPAALAAAPYVEHATPDLMRQLGVRDEDMAAVMDLVKGGGKSAPKTDGLGVKLKSGKAGIATKRADGGIELRDDKGTLLASVSPDSMGTLTSDLDSKTLDQVHAFAGLKAPSAGARTRADTPEADRFRMQKAAPKAAEPALPGTDANPHVKTSISASEAKVGDSIILPNGGRMTVASVEPGPHGLVTITGTTGRAVTVSPRQAMSRFDGAASSAPKAAPKAAPKSRAKGIVLDGRTDEDRYHYRKTDGTLEPQNDRVVNRLKRLEASARKAERDGDMFGAHQARQEFARITGEHERVITYLPGSNASGAAAGLPDGYKVKRDVIDGYGPVSTFSAYDGSGRRVGQHYNSPEAASRAAHQHSERAQKAEAERVALQERLKSERLAREAAHAKVVEDGRAAYAKPDTVDVKGQVETNHLVERMHNAPEAMQPGELARIASADHVAQHHRERAQQALNEQAFKRVQFMQGATDRRALNARLVDARSSMPAGPMRDALIAALERQLASLG